MDPLSVAASIAGLASLSLELARLIGGYYSSVKDAPKDIHDIKGELESLSTTLNRLEEVLRSDSIRSNTSLFTSSSVLISALNACKEKTRELSLKLEKPEKDRLSRAWERLKWPFSEKDVQKILKALRGYTVTFQFSLSVEGCALLASTSQHVSTSLEIQLDTSKRIYEMTKNIATMSASTKEAFRLSEQVAQMLQLISTFPDTVMQIQSLSSGVEALTVNSREEKKIRVLDWLSSSQVSRKHHDVCARRMPGTGQWLLDSTVFQDWRDGDESQNVLCCNGDPGVGKTVLASLAIDHLTSNFKTQDVGVSYFYFDYREQDIQTPAYFVASLLKQLAVQKACFPPPLLELYEKFKTESSQTLTTELSQVVKQVGITFDRLFVIIDALDECDGKRHRKEILRILKNLRVPPFRIFVTCRPHPQDIKQHFESATRIHVEASERDLRCFCSRMIDDNENVSELVDEALREDILFTISRNAKGMFLLPVLQIQEILDQMTKSEIKRCLRNLSANLDQVYEDTIRRIQGEPRNRQHVAMQSLMWISHARRPLHVDELRHALATELGDTDLDRDNLLPTKLIIETCSGLLILDDESFTVRLVHFTLQEYLMSVRQSLFPLGETLIANICLTYLCFEYASSPPILDKEEIGKTLYDYPFLLYASSEWGHHAKNAKLDGTYDLALRFLEDESKLSFSTQLRKLYSPIFTLKQAFGNFDVRQTGLHVAADFGIHDLVALLLDKGMNIQSRGVSGNTALHEAASNGHLDVTNLLLQRGAQVDAINHDYNTPLFLVSSKSKPDLVRLLLRHNANPNAFCFDEWTPLHKAADTGQHEVATLLLEHGADVLSRSARGLTALHRAAGRGYLGIVKMLLEHGSPINARTLNKWTPLAGASSSGQHEMVKLLLEQGADVNSCSDDGRSPLHRACRGGHLQTVLHLLHSNADVLCEDHCYQLPIHRAAKGGHRSVALVLLGHQKSRQLSAINGDDRTARQEAFYSGQWKTSQFLREEELLYLGAASEKRDEFSIAIEVHDASKVEKIAGHVFDVNRKDDDGLTPLHQALQTGASRIALILLDRGADIEAETTDGWRPIHFAARKGSEESVALCVKYRANVQASTKDGQTALHKACKAVDVKCAQTLLQNGADIEAIDDWGFRPLHTAAAAGSESIVKLLLEHGADFYARNNSGRTVQACAANSGHHDLVEFLRQQRGDSGEVHTVTHQLWPTAKRH